MIREFVKQISDKIQISNEFVGQFSHSPYIIIYDKPAMYASWQKIWKNGSIS